MGKNEVSYKSGLSRQQTLALLGDILASLEQGRLCLGVDGQLAELPFGEPGLVEAELSAARKKGKHKLSISLSWHIRQGESADPLQQLHIGSQPPPGHEEAEEQGLGREEAEAEPQPEDQRDSAPAQTKPEQKTAAEAQPARPAKTNSGQAPKAPAKKKAPARAKTTAAKRGKSGK